MSISFKPWVRLLAISLRPVRDAVCWRQGEAQQKGRPKWEEPSAFWFIDLPERHTDEGRVGREGNTEFESLVILLLPPGWPYVILRRRDRVNTDFILSPKPAPATRLSPSSQSLASDARGYCTAGPWRENIGWTKHWLTHLWSFWAKKVHNIFYLLAFTLKSREQEVAG